MIFQKRALLNHEKWNTETPGTPEHRNTETAIFSTFFFLEHQNTLS